MSRPVFAPHEVKRGAKVVVGYPVGGSVTLPFHASMLRLQQYELAKEGPMTLLVRGIVAELRLLGGKPVNLLWKLMRKLSDQSPRLARILQQVTSEIQRERAMERLIHVTGLYVAANRTAIVQRFLETDADWLLQIDTDIEFQGDIIERMLALAGENRKIVAANVPLGHFPSVAFTRNAEGISWTALQGIPGDIVECDAVATAVVLIHREVFETIAARHGQCWFNHLYVPDSPEGTQTSQFKWASIGEDMAFCVRAKEAGFRIYAGRVHGLRHHKTTPLTDDTSLRNAPPVDDAMGELVEA